MWEIELLKEGNIVRVMITGIMNMDQTINMIDEALIFGKEIDTDKYLLDCRNAVLNSSISISDIYYLPMNLDKLGGKRPNRVALIVTLENKRKEDFYFTETVFKNHGSMFQVFQKEGEAVEWLTKND